MTIRIQSHTVAVAVRTAVQALAGGGVTAAGLGLLAQYGTYLPAGAAASIGVALTWLAGVAHNALEDHGMIGAWLRQPTLAPGVAEKLAQKAQAAAQKEADQAAEKAAKAAPAAAPGIDALKAYVDQAIAGLAQQIPALLAQAPPPSSLPPATSNAGFTLGQPPEAAAIRPDPVYGNTVTAAPDATGISPPPPPIPPTPAP